MSRRTFHGNAVNYRRFKLTFPEDGKSLKASLTERTGLNDEPLEGVLSL